MRTDRRGLSGGNGRMAQDLLCVARSAGVMCQTSDRDAGSRHQSGKHFGVQTLQACPGKRVFECAPGKFVPEGKGAGLVTYHSDAEAALDVHLIRPGGLLQQPKLCFTGDDADQLGDFACCWGKHGGARKHSVAHCVRYRAGDPGQCFGHEEWVAARNSMQAFRWASGPLCEPCDRRFRKGQQRHSARARPRQVAEDEPQRMPRADFVVAIRNRKHGARAMNSAPQILEQVERRFVRPVHVFKDDQRRRLFQFIERRGENLVSVGSGTDRRQQRALRLTHWRAAGEASSRHPDRSPGARLEHTRAALQFRELLQQRRLADACFTAQKGDATAACRHAAEPFAQIGEASFTLEQFHRFRTHGRIR